MSYSQIHHGWDMKVETLKRVNLQQQPHACVTPFPNSPPSGQDILYRGASPYNDISKKNLILKKKCFHELVFTPHPITPQESLNTVDHDK